MALAVKSGCKLYQEFTALKVRAHPLGHARHQALGTNGDCKPLTNLTVRLGTGPRVSEAVRGGERVPRSRRSYYQSSFNPN